jgi:hypothetical protein
MRKFAGMTAAGAYRTRTPFATTAPLTMSSALLSRRRCSSATCCRLMKPAFLLLLAWLFSGCVSPGSRTDSRDYAVSTCAISAEDVSLVQRRARNYLARRPTSATDARLLAVEAHSVFPGEVQNLWVKLSHSQTSSSAYAQRRGQSFKLWCILLVDRSNQLPLTNQGYLLSNTPARGEVVQIGGHRALYIGTGSPGVY